jgi:hypothetical protein
LALRIIPCALASYNETVPSSIDELKKIYAASKAEDAVRLFSMAMDCAFF